MICLDTSVLVDLLRGDDEITGLLAETESPLGVTYPVMCELYKGVYKSAAPEKGEDEVGDLIRHLAHLRAGPGAAKEFGKLKQSYPEKSEFDLMIAAITIASDASLFTRDTDFADVSELSVEIV